MSTSHRRTWTHAGRCDVFATIWLLYLTQPHTPARHCLKSEDLDNRIAAQLAGRGARTRSTATQRSRGPRHQERER